MNRTLLLLCILIFSKTILAGNSKNQSPEPEKKNVPESKREAKGTKEMERKISTLRDSIKVVWEKWEKRKSTLRDSIKTLESKIKKFETSIREMETRKNELAEDICLLQAKKKQLEDENEKLSKSIFSKQCKEALKGILFVSAGILTFGFVIFIIRKMRIKKIEGIRRVGN